MQSTMSAPSATAATSSGRSRGERDPDLQLQLARSRDRRRDVPDRFVVEGDAVAARLAICGGRRRRRHLPLRGGRGRPRHDLGCARLELQVGVAFNPETRAGSRGRGRGRRRPRPLHQSSVPGDRDRRWIPEAVGRVRTLRGLCRRGADPGRRRHGPENIRDLYDAGATAAHPGRPSSGRDLRQGLPPARPGAGMSLRRALELAEGGARAGIPEPDRRRGRHHVGRRSGWWGRG